MILETRLVYFSSSAAASRKKREDSMRVYVDQKIEPYNRRVAVELDSSMTVAELVNQTQAVSAINVYYDSEANDLMYFGEQLDGKRAVVDAHRVAAQGCGDNIEYIGIALQGANGINVWNFVQGKEREDIEKNFYRNTAFLRDWAA
jgi:hypothetical protein